MEQKLEKIAIDKIDFLQSFNIREDFGNKETKDLEESLKITDGNVQPVIVCKNRNRYDLIAGERRLKALKNSGYTEALCIVYEKLNDVQRTLLMFNENLGRKNISWKEEIRCLKKLKNLGHDINVSYLQRDSCFSNTKKMWDLLEAFEAVEEYPELLNEKSRKSCIDKYRRLKRKEAGFERKRRDISLKSLTKKSLEKKDKFDSFVLEELKEEVEFYKTKSDNIYKTIKELDKIERLSKGVWLSDEVKSLVDSAKKCKNFGELSKKDQGCKDCKDEDRDLYTKCEFYTDEFGDKK